MAVKSKTETGAGFFNPVAWIASLGQAASEEETVIVSGGSRNPTHNTKRIAANHTHKRSKAEKSQVKKARACSRKHNNKGSSH